MKKILFLTPYPYNKAPSQRLKFEQYFPAFKENGFEITQRTFISVEFWEIVYKPINYFKKIFYSCSGYFKRVLYLFTVRKYDVVYIHLWMTPFGPPIFEWLYCKLAKKIIYDIDDLVFLKDNPHEKKYLAWIKGKDKPIYLMKRANHVITCTPYLDSFVRQFNQNTTDISSTINTDTYIPVNNYKNDHQIVIGWSGSHSTSKYLYLLKDVLLELKKVTNFKLLVMGDASFNISGLDIEAITWTEEKEISTLQRIDIGLYPLPLNEEWVLGKSGLKALQYMSLGIPTIATNVGCNDRVIENAISGYLVLTNDEWIEKIKLLISDAQLRKQIGTNARSRVEKYYSLKANAPIYLKILNNLL